MLILNCGGTFNKRYNVVDGTLEVPYDNRAIDTILKSTYGVYNIAGIVYKDSLDMTSEDRKMIANIILESNDDSFIMKQ